MYLCFYTWVHFIWGFWRYTFSPTFPLIIDSLISSWSCRGSRLHLLHVFIHVRLHCSPHLRERERESVVQIERCMMDGWWTGGWWLDVPSAPWPDCEPPPDLDSSLDLCPRDWRDKHIVITSKKNTTGVSLKSHWGPGSLNAPSHGAQQLVDLLQRSRGLHRTQELQGLAGGQQLDGQDWTHTGRVKE